MNAAHVQSVEEEIESPLLPQQQQQQQRHELNVVFSLLDSSTDRAAQLPWSLHDWLFVTALLSLLIGYFAAVSVWMGHYRGISWLLLLLLLYMLPLIVLMHVLGRYPANQEEGLQKRIEFWLYMTGRNGKFHIRAQCQLARFYQRQGLHVEELNMIVTILETTIIPTDSLRPYASPFYHRAAQINFILGRYDAALENLQAKLLLFEHHPGRVRTTLQVQETIHLIGKTQLRLERLEDALASFKSALAISQSKGFGQNMETAKSCLLVGTTCLELNKLDEAETHLAEGIAIVYMNHSGYPSSGVSARLYNTLGDVKRRRNKVQEARECYDCAIEVCRRLGKADESAEITELMAKLSSLTEDMQ